MKIFSLLRERIRRVGSLKQARERLKKTLDQKGQDRSSWVHVRPLDPDEAIGKDADPSFVIKKGKERVIEATFDGHRGQAFTDRPSIWSGNLAELLSLDLEDIPNRAVFVAGLNAVLSAVEELPGTLHCMDEDPSRCGPEVARILYDRFGPVRIGLVGLQPAILKALVARFGPDEVRVTDLNPDNIGETRAGVSIWDGEKDLPRLVGDCDVGLVTGSSVVNHTLDEILECFQQAGKPLLLFGNTISGVAALLGLERLCPFGRPG
jgi:uncharacterized protein (DUF4213/DUF364 family)